MSNSAIGLTVNINTLVKDGWCVELETGMRGGELRSWVKLRHFERGHSHRTRSMPADLATALMSVMRQAGVEPWDPSDLETRSCPNVGCEIAGPHEHVIGGPTANRGVL